MKLLLPILVFGMLTKVLSGDVHSALQDLHLVWSSGTNSLRSGLWIEGKDGCIHVQSNTISRVQLAVLNESSNTIHLYWPPAVEHRISVQLSVSNALSGSNPVFGLPPGRALEVLRNSHVREWAANGLKPMPLAPRCDQVYSWSEIDLTRTLMEFSKSLEPGLYNVFVVQHTYLVGTNGVSLEPIRFPPITATMEVSR
jgi:hypothetical protein